MANIEKIPKIGKVRKVARPPQKSRRFPVLEIDKETDQEKLESKISHAYPGTMIERLLVQWAIDQDLTFQVEKAMFHSFTMYRSTRIDLAVYNYPGFSQPIAIFAHGTYWHSGSRVFADEQIARRLRDAGWHVTTLWEPDILRAALNDRMDPYVDAAIRSPLVW